MQPQPTDIPPSNNNNKITENYLIEKYGIWFYGNLNNCLGIQKKSDDEDDIKNDSDDHFHRIVLSEKRLPKIQGSTAVNKPHSEELCWPVSLIHASRDFVVFFIEGIKEQFYVLSFGKWSIVSFTDLFKKMDRNGVVFNRILCSGVKNMIFEMNDRSLYLFKLGYRNLNGWKKLDCKSSDIEMISGSVHCQEMAFVRKDQPNVLYWIFVDESIVKKNVDFTISKIFTPFSYHVVFDMQNRYFIESYNELNQRVLEYIPTPFEHESPIKQLVGGYYFNIALLENGSIWASGDNIDVLNQTTSSLDFYFRVDISIPNILSVKAFGQFGAISTPNYHLFFGEMHKDETEKRNPQKYCIDVHSNHLRNLTIIETENKYLNIEGSEYLIFIYQKTHNPLLFTERDLQYFKTKLLQSLSLHHYVDISIIVSNSQ